MAETNIENIGITSDNNTTITNSTQRNQGQNIKHSLGVITVTPHILPPISHLTKEDIEIAGGREGLRSSQGFYIYRNKK